MNNLRDEYVHLDKLRRQVDLALEHVLPEGGPTRRLQAAMRHAVLSPGKRIRPLLALISAELLGCPVTSVMPAACALEFVHAASLVIDDLPCMDDAATRRGQPTVHRLYGQDVAVLTGVALLNEAYGLLARMSHIEDSARVQMVDLLSRTVGTQGLIAGQDGDLSREATSSLESLSEVHHQKTGVLFIASVEMGALAAGASDSERDALRRFALELGLAFQAFDDLDDADEVAIPEKGSANMLRFLGKDTLRAEASSRLTRAREALASGGPPMSTMGVYVDLFFAGR